MKLFTISVLGTLLACGTGKSVVGTSDSGSAETTPGGGSGTGGAETADDTGSSDDSGDGGGSGNGGDSGDASGGGGTASEACTVPTDERRQVSAEVTVDGVRREFRFSVPQADAGVELPVLMAFHGADGRNYPFPQEVNFEQLVEDEGVITVYPLSELLPVNEGEWQLNTREGFRQDVDFVEAILDTLATDYCVDAGRVYATGYSLGSMFTYEMACHLSGRFAAIASFAGTMPVEPDSCTLDDNIAVMHIHGRADWLISYRSEWDWKEWDSVGTMMDIPSLVTFWSEKNNCSVSSETSSTAGTHLIHDDCDGGVRVEHHGLSRVEHDWPSSIDGVSTHEVIWNFVSGFSRP